MALADYYDEAAKKSLDHYQQSSFLNRVLIQEPAIRFLYRHVRESAAQADSIVDIGCGNGEALLAALGAGKPKTVVINDISKEMLDVTEGRVRESYPDLDVVTMHGDLLEADLVGVPSASLVMCLGVINHVKAALPTFLDRLVRLSHRDILLSFCHDGFVLAARVGRAVRKMNMPYDTIATGDVKEELARRGALCIHQSYNFGIGFLSPVAVMKFRRVAG